MIRLLALILISSICTAQENYCHYPETNAYWDDLAIRAADNSDVIGLYKLRKELCAQVDSGGLTVEEATEKFEYERERVVKKLERGKF